MKYAAVQTKEVLLALLEKGSETPVTESQACSKPCFIGKTVEEYILFDKNALCG